MMVLVTRNRGLMVLDTLNFFYWLCNAHLRQGNKRTVSFFLIDIKLMPIKDVKGLIDKRLKTSQEKKCYNSF